MPTSNRVKQRRFPENSEPTAWVLEKEGFRPKGHTPGLVSRVFSLEGFFSLTCLGRSPTEHTQCWASVSQPHPPQAQSPPGPTSPGPLGRGQASLT